MRKKFLTYPKSAALLFCLGAWTTSAQAEILWKGDFETGDLSQWNGGLNLKKDERENVRVVTSPVFEGKYAAEIVIHPDDLWPNGHNRVELKYTGKHTAEGERAFYSLRFRLAQHASVHQDIAYFETESTWRQSFSFYVEPNGEGTRLALRTNLPQSKIQFETDVEKDTWHQLSWEVLWSQDSTQGQLSVWLDGKQLLLDAPAQTKPDENPLFVQVGFHRNQSEAPVDTLYLDAAWEATTRDEILAEQAGGPTNGGSTPEPGPGESPQPGEPTPPAGEETASAGERKSGCSLTPGSSAAPSWSLFALFGAGLTWALRRRDLARRGLARRSARI